MAIIDTIQISHTCCSNPMIITTPEGYRVCENCGTVINFDVYSNEERTKGNTGFAETSSIKMNENVGFVKRTFGSRTKIAYEDIEPAKMPYYRRLQMINRSLYTSLERTLMSASGIFSRYTSYLRLPAHIRIDAWKIFRHAAELGLTKGRSIRATLAAAIYTAIRVNNALVTFDTVNKETINDRRALHQAVQLIVAHVLPDLGMKYTPISIPDLVYARGYMYKIPIPILHDAHQIVAKSIKKFPMSFVGKDPNGVVSAAIYMAAKKHGVKITQATLAKMMGSCEVTIRHQMKLLKKAITTVV